MFTFRKNANCPSSERLLAFENHELPEGERDRISLHLRSCEFCAAEAGFYARYPQAEEKVEKTEIPYPLYELARALLGKKDRDSSVLYEMLSVTEYDY